MSCLLYVMSCLLYLSTPSEEITETTQWAQECKVHYHKLFIVLHFQAILT